MAVVMNRQIDSVKKCSVYYFLISIFFILGCKSQQIVPPPPVLSEYQYTAFCDLPKYLNQGSVYTRGVYSGVDEYWWLTSDNNDCKDLSSEMEFSEESAVSQKINKLLMKVHSEYWKYYLIVDVIGKFETGNVLGYGHLGSNKSQFTVDKFVHIQLIRKKKK